MRSLRRSAVLLTALVLLGALAGPAAAQPASTPTERALYQAGPNGRFLLDGEWLFRLDPGNVGLKQNPGLAIRLPTVSWVRRVTLLVYSAT